MKKILTILLVALLMVSCTPNDVTEDTQLTGESRPAINIGSTKLRFIEVDGMEYMIGSSVYEGSAISPFIVNLTLDKQELNK